MRNTDPQQIRSSLNAALTDLRDEHRAEPVPPEPHCLMAGVDAALEQKVLDLTQRQQIMDVHHHRKPEHLRRTVEIAEGISHPSTLRTVATNPKRNWAHNSSTCLPPQVRTQDFKGSFPITRTIGSSPISILRPVRRSDHLEAAGHTLWPPGAAAIQWVRASSPHTGSCLSDV